jgi:predicted HTH transcriptional regulator
MVREFVSEKIKAKFYAYVLKFSKKKLRFPIVPELQEQFDDISSQRVYQILDHLIKDGRVEKVGRYNYGLKKVK